MRQLSQRKEAILKIVIDSFIASGTPVGSLDIVTLHHLGVSPATVRNELAWLKDEGFLSQPHTSAGSMPSDKGYRYYVNALLDSEELAPEEQRLVKHMFHQVETEVEEWMALAALLLAQLAENAALVVPPKAARARLKRLHLIAVQSLLALLVLVLQNGRLRRQLVTLEQERSQDELDALSNKLNALYGGATRAQLASRAGGLTAEEARVTRAITTVMAAEDEREFEPPHLEGVRHLLGQPEFAQGRKALDIMDLMERQDLARSMLAQRQGEQVSVVIGEENREEALRELSMVVARYGVADEFTGAIGVVGPRRMRYSRSISAVRFLAALLGQLAAELHEGSSYRRTQ